jgi:hypothetical protein
MGTIVVDGNNYTVYGDLAAAKLYIAGLTTGGGVAWRALTDPEKQRRTLQAFLFLERQPWQGEAVNGPRPALQWPRTGVTYANGEPVASATVPVEIEYAEYELAAIYAVNADAYSQANNGSNVKRVKAGPVEVENFSGTATSGDATKFPTEVMDLVGQFLGAATASSARSSASGLCDESHFDHCGNVTPYTRNGAF